MNVINIHYRLSDGEICGWETGTPTARPGLKITSVVVDAGYHCVPDPKLHKIDTTTHELIDKTPEEIALAIMPTLIDVQQTVAMQLSGTDQYMMPDRPLNDDTRAAWSVYRQALRDLNKGNPAPTIIDMINNFPSRPDGFNVSAALRARLPQSPAQPAS